MRIPRIALLQPTMTPFAFLFGSGNDQALITLTGFDFASFHYILNNFEPPYNTFSPYSSDGKLRAINISEKRGRPRSMRKTHCLALMLTWGRTRRSDMVLCTLFGITSSVCSLFLRFGRRLLLKVVSNEENSRIRMPTTDEIESCKQAIASKYSLLKDVYCVADGLKLHLEQSGNSIIQNMFYNGWTHDHHVGNVFFFAPSGVIVACSVNAPGSMHDSTIAEWGGIYRKLKYVYDSCGPRCVVDSAFSKGYYPFLIKSSQDTLVASNGDAQSLSQIRQAVSIRQASEWGMCALQGSFPRL